MADTRQTTIRFSEDIYARLELTSGTTGLPINSIVIVACMEWLERHRPDVAYRRNLPKPSSDSMESDVTAPS
jgi:hypothetical protein